LSAQIPTPAGVIDQVRSAAAPEDAGGPLHEPGRMVQVGLDLPGQ